MKTPLLVFLLFFCFTATAQKSIPGKNTARLRCGTMEALELSLKTAAPQPVKPLSKIAARTEGSATSQTTDAEYVIPVVVHLVLPADDMAKVTDADVQWQIAQLNKDFSGLNEDSTNAASFYATRGHSNIRFCLAQQDQWGNPTNGIDRVATSITSFSVFTVARIKYGNSCGADAWDPEKYFNIWVGKSPSVLGIATFPGIGPTKEQGIAISLDAFSNNPAYATSGYDKGRTVVHEAGHYFGLYHSWGDDEGCNTSDFRQLPGSFAISGSDIVGSSNDQTIGDTPNQGGATEGCPAGSKRDNCATADPGVQYQNFMDYTADACYSLFTKLQVKRMEHLLTTYRSTLLSSNGCTPVQQFSNDVFLSAILNPGSGNCRTSGVTNFCAGSSFSPVVEIKNVGTAPLTSLQVFVTVDNSTPIIYNWSGLLAPNEKTTISLPPIANSISGTHNLNIYTSNPNGTADARTTNDTLSTAFSVAGVTTLTHVEEGFTSGDFPPPGWKIRNPDGDLTWEHTTQVGKKENGAALFRDWENPTNNRVDDLITPGFTYQNVDSVFVHFQLANAMYSSAGSIAPVDTFSVLLSKDCGNTYTTIYKKWGKELQTVTGTWPQDIEFFPRSASDWRRDSINLGLHLGTSEPQFQLAFRFHGNFENNFFLDDVNLYTRVVPQALKEKGFLILPTVTQSSFAVWHYQQPTTLRSLTVYNAAGQLIVKKNFKGNAEKYIAVNLSGNAAGIYLVNLQYEDEGRQVTQRIVKY